MELLAGLSIVDRFTSLIFDSKHFFRYLKSISGPVEKLFLTTKNLSAHLRAFGRFAKEFFVLIY
mgnify:FL=1